MEQRKFREAFCFSALQSKLGGKKKFRLAFSAIHIIEKEKALLGTTEKQEPHFPLWGKITPP